MVSNLPAPTWKSFWLIFENFLKTFWWLPFKLANSKNCGRRTCQLSERECVAWHLRLLLFLHFDWPVETKAIRKLSKSCQKDVKNQSKTLSSDNGRALFNVIDCRYFTLKTSLAHNLKDSSWPHNSSPSPIFNTGSPPSSRMILSSERANAQKFG